MLSGSPLTEFARCSAVTDRAAATCRRPRPVRRHSRYRRHRRAADRPRAGRTAFVADAADGADQRLVLGAEFRPQPPHVNVHRSGAAEEVVAPNLCSSWAPEIRRRAAPGNFQQFELLVVRSSGGPCSRAVVVPRRSPPPRLTFPALSFLAALRRPTSSRNRASISAGPVAGSRIVDPQSTVTATRPPLADHAGYHRNRRAGGAQQPA